MRPAARAFPVSTSHPKGKKPICVGSGFVALDLVLIGNEQRKASFEFAGGSCGNVLTILAYLGWNSVPVLRLKNDREARKLVADFERWNVDTTFIRQERAGITPVVVQRICTTMSGETYHRFEWISPTSGKALPRYRPLPMRVAEEVSVLLPQESVFFFDRPAKSALLLAQRAKEQGALVFFEPTSIGDRAVFTECVAASDILKYSADRVPSLSFLSGAIRPRLEIQTLGKDGLRYALRSESVGRRRWKRLHALKVADLKDAAGAGDWCTAGIIDSLAHGGRASFTSSSEAQIVEAMRYGQSLASVNCAYEGARGGMYKLDKDEFKRIAAEILSEAKLPT